MEFLFAKSYLHFLKFNGFEDYHNILKEFFKDNLQNEIYLELEKISNDSIETFNFFKNYFKNNEELFDEEKFEIALMLGIKKEYAETDDIAGFGSKCHNLWEELPEILSNKEPFLTLRYFDGYLDANEAKARKIMKKTLSDYNYIENYEYIKKRKENIKKNAIILAVIVLIVTVLIIYYLDVLTMILVLFLFTGPLLIADLLYYLIEKKSIKKEIDKKRIDKKEK